ncbi:MAG: hypothetical protein JXR34_10475 [Bacteroidales bacterium]|nr:hypothetical protein [Bacteroidales bacterium]
MSRFSNINIVHINFSIFQKMLTFTLLVISTFTQAQFYNGSQMSFGKNRIQTDDERTWTYFRFKQFDTYFYNEGRAIAIYTSAFADSEIDRMTKFLDYGLEQKINFVVFNDLSDLKETNIGLLTNEQYNIGGETHIIDNKVFIYFGGDHPEFEAQISKGIAQVFLNQIFYGGSLGSTIKNSILLSFPKWYTEGFISFMSENWSTEIDSKVRDGFISGRYRDFKHLSAEEQKWVGHSLWNYINEKYGRRALTDVLFLAKINRNIESGFVYVLGTTYLGLIDEWYNYYQTRYIAELTKGFVNPQSPLFKRYSAKKKITAASLNADGRYLAYVENQIGKVKLKTMDLQKQKIKKVHKFGYKLDEKVDYSSPVIAWSPNADFLSYVIEKQGDLVLIHYDLEKKRKTKKFLNSFDKVLSMSYNSRGNQIVMSAVVKGQSDIFVYNIGSNTYQQITKDIFDDENPVFVNKDNAILFSSNRLDDTLRFDVETGKNVIIDTIRGKDHSDIFLYDLQKRKTVLKRVTNTDGVEEKMPEYLSYNRFAWLSNESGVYNRIVGRFDSAIAYIDTVVHYAHFAKSYPTTTFINDIKLQDINKEVSKLVEIIPQNGRDYIYIKDIDEKESFEQLEPIYTSYREDLMKKESARKPVKDLNVDNKNPDTTAIEIPPASPDRKKFKVLYIGESSDTTSIISEKTTSKVEDKAIERPVTTKQTSEQLYRTKNYEVQFSITELVSQMDFSYMNLSYQPFVNSGTPVFNNQGFAAFMKFGIMDLMEDYRLVAGVNISPTFQENEYLLSLTNLKKRLDKEYTFHRMILTSTNEKGYVYNYVHEGFIKLSWPFDNVRSVRTTFNVRNDYKVQKAIDHNSIIEPDISEYRVGMKMEYVFDNTRNPALNIHYGTRYKLFAEYFQPVSNLSDQTIILGVDYRKYTKLIGNFIWANRFAASTSLGSQRLMYYLGALDNWMFPSFNTNIQVDQTNDYIYQTTATNLRGFQQNIRNGNSFFVINSELRLPPFSLFGKRPVKSDFLANFQIVGFFDLGTAWSGPNPFSDSNSLFRQEFYQKPINVIVINQNDPIVAGYGFGLRSRIFGYFVRADWAWGIQNGYRQKAQFYLSLSLDF